MNSNDSSSRREDANRDGQDPAAPPPAPRKVTPAPIDAPLLGEPQVVLKDPPVIFGGGSHTW